MNRPDDHEAKMARADLFKLAQYSFKLFKMIGENQELEGWVQAKITKAADYISSVYHYMQYEMQVSEYGDHLENAEMYSESIRRAFQQKLMEAKKMKEKAKAEMLKKEKALDETVIPQNPDGATAPPPKGKDGQYPMVTSGPNKGKRWSPTTPGPTIPDKTPVKPGTTPEKAKLDPRYKSDPEFKKEVDTAMKIGVKENLKGGQKKLDVDKDGKLEKSDFAKLRANKSVKEAEDRKPAKKSEREVELPSGAKVKATKVQGWQSQKADKDADKERKDSYKAEAADKCNHTPKGKKCPEHGLKECGSMYEASHQAKTTMKHVKDSTPGEKKAAKDIKPGIKGYSDRVAMLKSAEKDGRLGEAKNLKQQAAIAIAKKKAK